MAGFKRRNYLIDRAVQLPFIMKFSVITILASIIVGAFIFLLSQSSTTVAIENTTVQVKTTADFILPLISLTVLLVALFSAVVVFIMALFISHRFVGPAYRLRKEVQRLKGGDMGCTYKIRAKDHLKELAEELYRMTGVLRGHHVSLQEKYRVLEAFLKDRQSKLDDNEQAQLQSMLDEINEQLRFFKVE